MTIELTPFEAEILIAVLTGAEGAFAIANPPLVEAMKELRPWRSALIQAYLKERWSRVLAPDTPPPPSGAPSASE